MHKCKNAIYSTFCILLALTVLLATFCDDGLKIETKCDLIAQLIFVNNSSDSLDITLVDSTKWISLALLKSQESFLPESTIHVADSLAVIDTARILWSFEHEDIFDTGVVCSAKVNLEIMAIIWKNDSILSVEDLGLCCSEADIDTAYTDSTGVEVVKFYCSKTVFLPQ